jgi:hypothetical protein
MRIFLLIVLLSSCLFGELSLSLGQTSGSYLQSIQNANGTFLKKAPLAGRPAFFFELDSCDHPLWLKNDRVIFGLAAFAENRHRDYVERFNYAAYVPLYMNYYLQLTKNWSVGAGINFNIMQLRYKNQTAMAGQQLGKNLLIRYDSAANNFFEFGLLQTVDAIIYENDIECWYDATNFIFKYGFYLERDKTTK